jgi:hypothetical protein
LPEAVLSLFKLFRRPVVFFFFFQSINVVLHVHFFLVLYPLSDDSR